ncbi:MAG: peptide chain release factor N(5)-glutamine methyltransferase [Alphaproteobacteria bacterium]
MSEAMAYKRSPLIPAVSCLRHGTSLLQAAGIDSAPLDARILLLDVLQMTAEEWVAQPERLISQDELQAYQQLIDRRATRQPVAQLIGRREFWGLEFRVTADTLDPRPDSETLIETVLNLCSEREHAYTILDMGTGTGCLLLSLLYEYPRATGVGLDRSVAALAVARHNALQLELNSRAEFIHSHWDDYSASGFDIVISNPPYIPTSGITSLAPEVSQYEPKIALDGGPDGLICYRQIFTLLPNLLKEEGIAIFEIGQGQAPLVSRLADDHGFTVEAITKDMQGIDRCIVCKPTTKD